MTEKGESTGHDEAPLTSASVGERVFIHLEHDDEIEADVELAFVYNVYDADSGALIKFGDTPDEILEAQPAKPKSHSLKKLAWRVQWIVKDAGFQPPFDVQFIIKVRTQSGKTVVLCPSDRLYIPRITITKHPALLRIMQTEFSRREGNRWVFDPEPVQTFIDKLTVEQRRVLHDTPVKVPDDPSEPFGRLVCFMTLYKNKGLLMGANIGMRREARPNAYFTVFHCMGPGRPVTLICHTEHLLINFEQDQPTDATRQFFLAREQAGQLKRNNPRPGRFKIGCWVPSTADGKDADDGVVFLTIHDAKGTHIMPANALHGLVNTAGCWMLFRNYNWPKAHYARLSRFYVFTWRSLHIRRAEISQIVTKLGSPPVAVDRINALAPYMRQNWRDRMGEHRPLSLNERKALEADLLQDYCYDGPDGIAAAGYTERKETSEHSSGMAKMLYYDRNWAYTWFLHDIVGLRYFSRSWRYQGAGGREGRTAMHEWHLGAQETAPAMPLAELKGTAYTTPDDTAGCFHHDGFIGKTMDNLKVDDTIYGENVLGFRAAETFAPGLASVPNIDQVAWGDLFFYRENDNEPLVTKLFTKDDD